MTGPWYLAGPMTGYPLFNFPAFHFAAKRARDLGYTVVSPAELNEDAIDANSESMRSVYMRRDIEALLRCVGVLVLPGWELSRGARLEVEIAVQLALPVLHAETFLPVEMHNGSLRR